MAECRACYRQNPPVEIDIRPCEIEQFAATAAGVDREQHQRFHMVCESQLPQTWQQHITAFAAPAVGGIALGAAALFAGIERRAQAGLRSEEHTSELQ